jgi:putative membrane protein
MERTMKLSLALLSAGLIGLGAAGASLAAVPPPDKSFATKAAQGGLAEVQTGQLVQQRNASPQAKQFAETLVQDHTQANDQLQQIAQQKDLNLPQQPSSDQRSELKKLGSLSGAQLDKAFARYEVQDHKQDIAMFEKEAKSGKDPELKDFAQKALPVLRRHLQMAQALENNTQQ